MKSKYQHSLRHTDPPGAQWAVPSCGLGDFICRLVTVPAIQSVGQIEWDDVCKVATGHLGCAHMGWWCHVSEVTNPSQCYNVLRIFLFETESQ